MSIYDRLGALAQRLLDKFGGDATLSSITRAYDPSTGSVALTEVPRTVRAVLGSRTIRGDAGQTVVQTIATLMAAPAVGEGLTIGSRRFTVESVEIVDPTGSQPIVYRAVLK